MTTRQVIDWGASGRVDTYSFAMVDPFTLSEVSVAEAKAGTSSLTWAYDSDNQLQGTLDIDAANYHVDGMYYMVRVYHEVDIGSYHDKSPMGTLFVSNLTNEAQMGHSGRRLTCYGPMWRYTQDYLDHDVVGHAGDNCADIVRSVVEEVGGKISFIDGFNTAKTHTMDILWPIGTNRAEVLYTYAGWLNAEIVTQPDGSIAMRPYIDYASRAPVYAFEAGDNCIYKSGITWETNRDEPTNRVVAYFSREQKQEDDPYPLSDSVTLDLPSSADFSYAHTGRRRTEVLQVTEPCDHASLQSQAQRLLDSTSGAWLDIVIEHASVPFLKVGDCVSFENRYDHDAPFRTSCIVMEMSVSSLAPFCMTQTKLRTVAW